MPRAEAAAQLEHFALRPAVDQRLVGGVDRHAELRREPEQHPLPVALVRGHEQHRLAARHLVADQLGFNELHAPLELGRREPQRMHHFDEHVGEAAVVVADHALARGVIPLRERGLEIGHHHVAAIRKYAPGQEGEETRDGIPERQRDP